MSLNVFVVLSLMAWVVTNYALLRWRMSRIRQKGGENVESAKDWGVQVIVRTTSLIWLIVLLALGINWREQDGQDSDPAAPRLADSLSESGHPDAGN